MITMLADDAAVEEVMLGDGAGVWREAEAPFTSR